MRWTREKSAEGFVDHVSDCGRFRVEAGHTADGGWDLLDQGVFHDTFVLLDHAKKRARLLAKYAPGQIVGIGAVRSAAHVTTRRMDRYRRRYA